MQAADAKNFLQAAMRELNREGVSFELWALDDEKYLAIYAEDGEARITPKELP